MSSASSRRAQERFANEISGPRHTIADNMYDKDLYPQGTINLSTAENMLMTNELLEYMHAHFKMTPSHLKYRYSLEKSQVPNTVQALPRYINASLKPRQPITPEQTVSGPGLGSLIAQFIWSICDEGEGVMLTTPYYDDFKRDIIFPARARLVPAHVPAEVDSLMPGALKYAEEAIQKSKADGIRVRILILCNPHNPIARAYPEESILEYARFAEKHDLQLLVDEVYGNQVFASKYEQNPPQFISILSLDIERLTGCNPARIHVLAGPAKDFSASGVKIGSLVSQHNPDLLKLIKVGLYATPMSSAADALFTPILNDDKFTNWFLEENRKRLADAIELVGPWCEHHGFPFVVPCAGIFFLVNLSSVLWKFGKDATLDEQLDALVASMQKHGVFMRPTYGNQDPVKGRFRMTFAIDRGTMLIALKRLEDAMGLAHWDPSTQ